MAKVDSALAPVADAIEGFVLRGGKRLRPAFGYWGFRGAGGHDSDQVVTALAALELVQASALIHDDLIDRSDTRRGEPAVHRRFAGRHRDHGWSGDADGFGDSAAVLLGDLCLVWSDELLHAGGLDPEALFRARPVFDEMRTEVTIGQYLDVLTQVTGNTSIERAGKVARLKSAKYTVERPLLLGAALAAAPEPVAAAYSSYGLPLGEAFQLRDDMLGVFGDPALTGKPAGDDLREGKRTFLVAAAFEAADEPGRADLQQLLGAPDLDAAGITRLREVIVLSGAAERTERRITALLDLALSAIDAAPIEVEARDALIDLAHAATTRTD
ncbi:polyprenyl synthetase family protein [Asanoa sp. WMMD1127]|uniref:polyprenyl synthetase family protein n=1 Tax=Asanoa sp. WMMD1127 TaxID=3016107 RepID=UPI002417B595|nr:polyprenyl synthetase family protein [Asanoa sp. WMMD1127]MDG4827114.1 polyprenyl synthetase family protein [Asanoa sp. WMMD1127]